VVGRAAFFMGNYLLFSIAAVSGGLYAIEMVRSEPQFSQHLENRQRVLVSATVGVVLGATAYVVRLAWTFFRVFLGVSTNP
jgi:hypothetical protein